MTREEFLELCGKIDGAQVDMPFENDFVTTVIRHKGSGKWFALLMLYEGKYIVNLKCSPEESDFLRQAYKGVIPAYHMNKRLWNSVYLESDVPDGEIKRQIMTSFALTDTRKGEKMSVKGKSSAKKTALLAVEGLEKIYPDALCSLVYEKPYELMIAGRLSAQCTDARVNIVTKVLFEKYPTLEAFANADIEDVAEIVKPCGLYRTKAKSIVEMSRQLLYDYGGEIPKTVEELTKLSGIGRKTANLIMGDVHHLPAVVTDTHCIRICGRLGLTRSKDPKTVEDDLRKLLPPESSSDFCHRLVLFGRDTCTARSPKCESCPLQRYFRENGNDMVCRL